MSTESAWDMDVIFDKSGVYPPGQYVERLNYLESYDMGISQGEYPVSMNVKDYILWTIRWFKYQQECYGTLFAIQDCWKGKVLGYFSNRRYQIRMLKGLQSEGCHSFRVALWMLARLYDKKHVQRMISWKI